MSPLQEMARDLAAAGNPARLAMLLRLAEGPAWGPDLDRAAGVGKPRGHYHRGVLRHARLIEIRKGGPALGLSPSCRLAEHVPLWLAHVLREVREAEAIEAADAAKEVA